MPLVSSRFPTSLSELRPDTGYQGYSFAPPNTVAPHRPDAVMAAGGHGGHRPDAVMGGGVHRFALSPRVMADNAAPIRGGYELTQVRGTTGHTMVTNTESLQDVRNSYTERHYAGSNNTVAPQPLSFHNQNVMSPHHQGFHRTSGLFKPSQLETMLTMIIFRHVWTKFRLPLPQVSISKLS